MFEQAIEREAKLRPKTGTEEGETCRSNAPEIVRILVLLAEQTQRLKKEGLTCPECGTTTTLDMPSTDFHKGIFITCSLCKTSLAQCKAMESAGIPTEQIEYANKLVEIKRNATDKLGQHLEINKKGKKGHAPQETDNSRRGHSSNSRRKAH